MKILRRASFVLADNALSAAMFSSLRRSAAIIVASHGCGMSLPLLSNEDVTQCCNPNSRRSSEILSAWSATICTNMARHGLFSGILYKTEQEHLLRARAKLVTA